MRRAAKIDANQPEIVKALRGAGCCVLSLAAVGKGCPDLLVSEPEYPHSMILLEVKDGSLSPSDRKLKPLQVEFLANWKGPVAVVKSVPEALTAMGIPHDRS